ncbi:MAG: hypothetical protein ACRCSG_07040 [Cellulosilyticaceae bacterium]
MNSKNKKFIAITSIAIASLSLSLSAAPILKKVQAYFNPTITYIVEGEEITGTTNALTYRDTTYLPLAEITRLLGDNISYDKGVITITKPDADLNTIDENINLISPSIDDIVQQSLTIERAYVTDVDAVNKRITVALENEEGEVLDTIIFLTSDNTTYSSAVNPDVTKTFENILVGSPVKIEHSMIMMPSFPAQIEAYSFTLLEEPATCTPPPAALQNVLIPEANIIEQNLEFNTVTISYVHPETNETDTAVLNVTPETFIHHELNKRMYFFEDLAIGTKVSVVHSPVMTMSIPPQTNAIEIVILQNQN